MKRFWLGILGLIILNPLLVFAAEEKEADKEGEGETRSTFRVREGQQLTDVVGKITISGDRATFRSNKPVHQYLILENLNLDRIQTTSHGQGEGLDLEWSISGVVTEYKTGNYLLISKAILKTKITQSDTKKRSLTRPSDKDSATPPGKL